MVGVRFSRRVTKSVSYFALYASGVPAFAGMTAWGKVCRAEYYRPIHFPFRSALPDMLPLRDGRFACGIAFQADISAEP